MPGHPRQGAEEPVGAPLERLVTQRGHFLPCLVRQFLKGQAQNLAGARGEYLVPFFVFLLPVVAPGVGSAVAGAGAQVLTHPVRGLLGGGERRVDDQQLVGERLGAQQYARLCEEGLLYVTGDAREDHGERVVRQSVNDAGCQGGDNLGIVSGRGDVEVVDHEDAAREVDELFELRAELTGGIEKLLRHHSGEGLLVGHALAKVVGLPVQAACSAQTAHRLLVRKEGDLPRLDALCGRVDKAVDMPELQPQCAGIRLGLGPGCLVGHRLPLAVQAPSAGATNPG